MKFTTQIKHWSEVLASKGAANLSWQSIVLQEGCAISALSSPRLYIVRILNLTYLHARNRVPGVLYLLMRQRTSLLVPSSCINYHTKRYRNNMWWFVMNAEVWYFPTVKEHGPGTNNGMRWAHKLQMLQRIYTLIKLPQNDTFIGLWWMVLMNCLEDSEHRLTVFV